MLPKAAAAIVDIESNAPNETSIYSPAVQRENDYI